MAREPDEVVEHHNHTRGQREGVGAKWLARPELEPVGRGAAGALHERRELRAQRLLARGRQRGRLEQEAIHALQRALAQQRLGFPRDAARDLVGGERQAAIDEEPRAERDQCHGERSEQRPRLPRVQHAIVAARARDAVHRVVVLRHAGAAARQVEPARRIGDAQAPPHAPQVEDLADVGADQLQPGAAGEQRHAMAHGRLAVVIVGLERLHMPRSTLKRSPISWPVAPTRGSRPLAWCTMSSPTMIARHASR